MYRERLQYVCLGVVFFGIVLLTVVLNAAALEGRREKVEVDKQKLSGLQAEEIFNSDEALFAYVKRFGPQATVAKLHELQSTMGSCHDVAHKAGRFAYQLYDAAAFKLCSSECHSGCYHGATEAFFKEHGTAHLASDVSTLCSSELNAFFSHQCLHGIGHGLMAWTNYELFDALGSCNLLPQGQDSCWTGVFMENIVGGLALSTFDNSDGHSSQYLNDDPQYPCTIVDSKYKSACYFLQTSRMMQLFEGDFAKIAAECGKVAVSYRHACFESMGRDVGGTYRGDPETAVAQCVHAPKEFRRSCLAGAAQDFFWDKSGADAALTFCSLVKDGVEKEACYATLASRASQIFTSWVEGERFCKKVEDEYEKICLSLLGHLASETPESALSAQSERAPEQKSKVSLQGLDTKNVSSFNAVFITMRDDGYDPARVVILKGQTVTFVNKGSKDHWPASNIHPSHEIYPEFDPRRPILPESSWSFRFDREGEWRFHDHLDPRLGGVILVVSLLNKTVQ